MTKQWSVDSGLLRVCARRQSRVSWAFATIGAVLYFGYLGLMTVNPPLMSAVLPGTRSITVAIAAGYLMIALVVLLTGLFVIVNNRYVRPLLMKLRKP